MTAISALFILLCTCPTTANLLTAMKKQKPFIPKITKYQHQQKKFRTKPKSQKSELDAQQRQHYVQKILDTCFVKKNNTPFKHNLPQWIISFFMLLSKELAAMIILILFLIIFAFYLMQKKKTQQKASASLVVETFSRESEGCTDEATLSNLRYKTLDKLIRLELANNFFSNAEHALEWEYFERYDAIWRKKKAQVERILAIFLHRGKSCPDKFSLNLLLAKMQDEIFELKLPADLALETQASLKEKQGECEEDICQRKKTRLHIIDKKKLQASPAPVADFACPSCGETIISPEPHQEWLAKSDRHS